MQKETIIKEAEIMTTAIRSLADALLDDGKFDDARDVLTEAIPVIPDDELDELLACKNLLAKVERAAGNLQEALIIHLESYPLVQLTSHHSLKAKFHNGLGITYEMLCEYDRALIEYEAVRFHTEEAGDMASVGYAVVNIAKVLCELNRGTEARAHLDSGRAYFAQNPVALAQLNETEARICLKEEKPLEALSLAMDACQTFIRQGQKKLLDDSLPTLLKALADYRCEESQRSY
jgi:tetratricopeptide (TPR) repeat protein